MVVAGHTGLLSCEAADTIDRVERHDDRRARELRAPTIEVTDFGSLELLARRLPRYRVRRCWANERPPPFETGCRLRRGMSPRRADPT
jgi:hypothetical protein